MHGTLTMTVVASVAALVLVGAKPALATPAGAALAYADTNPGVVEHIARRDRYVRKWRRGPYYRGYAHRPYYWGRPYAYYDYPYYYRRGPGVSFWFGF